MLTLCFIHLLALATPGPDFLLVSKTAVGASRRAALLAALGITLGVMVWAALALLGLHLLFERLVWLQGLIKLLGGAYLIYLGALLWKASFAPASSTPELKPSAACPLSNLAALRSGLLTNLANPKVAVYFGSIFATFITPVTPWLTKIAIFALVSSESLLWFTLVTLAFSLPGPQSLYLRAQKSLDRLAGTAFAAFGLRLVWMSWNKTQ